VGDPPTLLPIITRRLLDPDSTARHHRVGVVIPARNEAARIGQVLAEIANRVEDLPVLALVVDDGSTDGTDNVARAHGARVITHAINLGKGAAMKTGCAAGLAAGCDVLVLMDADGQHRPSDLPAIVGPILSGEADLVLGRRRFTGQMPATARLGNWGLTRLFTVMFGATYGDTQCGLRAFTSDAYYKVDWLATDYAVETEMLVRAARARLRTVEVDIETIYHDVYKGTTMLDGLRILAQMIRWRLSG
jgi:glycosyltransferase involved in cell wall biosynthesis